MPQWNAVFTKDTDAIPPQQHVQTLWSVARGMQTLGMDTLTLDYKGFLITVNIRDYGTRSSQRIPRSWRPTATYRSTR
jgi:hypothetical protein